MKAAGQALRPIRPARTKRTDPLGRVCAVEGCGRMLHAAGLCVSHNKMRLRGEPMRDISFARAWGERSHTVCTVSGCGKPHSGRGLCVKHLNIHKTYGIDPAQYDRMFAVQGGKCAICGTAHEAVAKGLCIDHDHATGEVRGLLCGACNTALGKFRDDPRLLTRAIRYLEAARAIADAA